VRRPDRDVGILVQGGKQISGSLRKVDQRPFDNITARGLASLPASVYADNAVTGVLLSARRQRIVVALAVLVALGLAGVVLTAFPKRYHAEAVVQFNFGRQDGDTGAGPDSSLTLDPTAVVQGEAVVLRSHMMARRIVTRLGLAAEPEQPEKSIWNTLAAWLPRTFLSNYLSDGVLQPVTSADQAERDLMSRLTIGTDNRSYVLTIGYTADSPKAAARIANAVANEYIEERAEAKAGADNRRAGWLEAQIVASTRELGDAENAVAAYRAKVGLVESPSGGDSVGDQQLTSLTSQANDASLARMAAETRLARIQELSRSGAALATSDLQDLPTIQALIQRERTARTDLVELQTRLGMLHPSVVQAQASLNSAVTALNAEVARTVSGLEANVEATQRMERVLTDRLNALRVQVIAAKARQSTLRNLDDQARAIRERLSSLRRSYDQVVASRALGVVAASLAVQAQAVRFSASPNPIVILAAALLAGLLIGISCAVLIERRDHGLRSSTEVTPSMGVRCLGMLPEVSRKTLVDSEPLGRKRTLERSMLDEAIRMVGAGVQMFDGASTGRVVLVTSVAPGEGKSVFVQALADVIVMSGQRVLVINGAPSCNGQPESGQHDSHDVIDPTPLNGVRHLVVKRKVVSSFANEVFDTDYVTRLLDDARRHFDIVLVEGPPVMLVADSLVLARYVDTTILLVRWATTSRVWIEATLRCMRENSVAIDGLVLTRVDLSRHARMRFSDQCAQYLRQRYFYGRLSGRSKARRSDSARAA
jgi:polysaccharide biosynthesis transport protein